MGSSAPSSPPRSRRVEIIAEIANAHQGDPTAAGELARAALEAGADAVKFQIYFAEELLTEGHPRFAHFQRQAFSADVWRNLIAKVQDRGGRVYCDVFGLKAFEIASEAKVSGYKVHSSDLGNEPLIRAVAQMRQPLMLAVGGSTAREIAKAVAIVTRGNVVRPVLMHGFQSYPTPIEDTCLIRLVWLRQLFGDSCDVGYMDHIGADDPLAITLPVLALGMGATVIEKHLTFNRTACGVDYYSSLNPAEFAEFVRVIRRAELAVGQDPERFAVSERSYRRQVKKYWVTSRPRGRGEVLGPEDVVMKRAEVAAEVPDLEQLLGRPLLGDRPRDHVLTRRDVPQQVWGLVVARMRSSRLPGKALADVGGMPALAHLFERLKQARTVDRLVLCTTREPEDQPLVRLAAQAGIAVCCGDTDNVLARMVGAIEGQAVDVVLRVTGDDILVDPDYVDRAVAHHLEANAEYTDMKALPSGTEVEMFDAALLRLLARLARDASGTEYLTSYVVHHRDQFRTSNGPVDPAHRRDWRLTLDTPEDLEVIRTFLTAMRDQGKAVSYRMDDVVTYFTAHSEVLAVNASVRQRQTPPEVSTELVWARLGVMGTGRGGRGGGEGTAPCVG